MKISFFDRQDESNPNHGVPVQDSTWLMVRIDELRKRDPSFCELEAQNGYKLLLGIGQDRGCAQYSALDGSPPYLMATDVSVDDDEDCMEFLTANTDTPVPTRYCLPVEQIKEIAREFVGTGERSEEFIWEEV
ncbi:MAG: Imm1 family immunity protein [Thermoguttaceae bacterium]